MPPRTEAANDKSTAVLLVSCPDRKGLVAALAQLLFGHGVNLLSTDQHTDASAGMFFQRIHFDTAEMDTGRPGLEAALGKLAERFDMAWRLHWNSERKRVAIFVSKFDHCLWDLLLRHRAGELDCAIPLIVSNHPDLEPIAKQFGIDYRIVPIAKDTKAAQETVELELLSETGIDLVVLARYMQVLSGEFIESFGSSRIINIHHSFLPAFMGSKPYHRGTGVASNESAQRPTTQPQTSTRARSSSRM
jgi:formyltetrahydrofolate deformylase